ncbi:PPOX class F420-dependent oxidoreductase [Euzebya sp.]|uniref:PPOX class F420-dependent oxidoreductase n=1 Tax=Euzebya sp. TaxID=1971409 RepID=UPI003514EB09
MEISDAVPFLAERSKAVIVTLSEGSAGDVPHATNVVYGFDGRVARVSLTDDRVKTDNLRRRPLAVLHVVSDDFWSYVAAECDVELSAVSTEPGDAPGRELLELYESVQGPHPDPEEFFQAMVDDRRLVARLTPTRVYGQLPR